jgi:pimeloyl-ACP methyl ester carboxylesterase
LREHGDSPRAAYGLTLEDLTEDLYDTVLGLLEPATERIDVLLDHSLGALAAIELCEKHAGLVERLVLEEPPGSENSDFDEVARMVESDVARTREAPDEMKREQLEENHLWTEEDAANNVASLRDCDAAPVAEMMRSDLRYDLAALVGSVEIPSLLILGSEARFGYARARANEYSARATPRYGEGVRHSPRVHREDFEGYVKLLRDWLRVGSLSVRAPVRALLARSQGTMWPTQPLRWACSSAGAGPQGARRGLGPAALLLLPPTSSRTVAWGSRLPHRSHLLCQATTRNARL